MTEELNELGSNLGEPLYVYAPGYVDLKILLNLFNQPVVKYNYRLFLLNSDETVNHQIPDEDIIIDECSYNENYQNGQRRNISITLNNIDGKYTPSINGLWLTTKFRLDIGISSPVHFQQTDGKKEGRNIENTTYWFPKGIYILGNPVANHNNADKTVELVLSDKFAYLESPVGTLDTTYEISQGQEIKEVIIQTLNLDNGMGLPLDPRPIYYDASFEGKTMPYDYNKDAGSTIGEIFLDIATILDAEVFYNSVGTLTFIPTNSAMHDVDKPTLWDYSEEDADTSSITTSYDFENAINSIQIVGDQIKSAIFYGSAENNNPLSPICVKKIGRRTLYLNDSNIYSNQLAKERASYELRLRGILSTSNTVAVFCNPLLFVDNIITLTDSFLNYNREKFLIQSISYNLGSDNQMTLTCSNIQNFIPNEDDYLQSVECNNATQAMNLVVMNWYNGTVPTNEALYYDSVDDEAFYIGCENRTTHEIIRKFKVNKSDSHISLVDISS